MLNNLFFFLRLPSSVSISSLSLSLTLFSRFVCLCLRVHNSAFLLFLFCRLPFPLIHQSIGNAQNRGLACPSRLAKVRWVVAVVRRGCPPSMARLVVARRPRRDIRRLRAAQRHRHCITSNRSSRVTRTIVCTTIFHSGLNRVSVSITIVV